MRILIFAFLATSLLSCSQKKGITTNTTEPAQSAAEVVSEVAAQGDKKFMNDCYSDRAVTKEVSGQNVNMVKVMNQYMFAFDNTRWQPCEVPAEFQVEGMKVKVSGEVLEIKPNERRAGTPFNITKLEKM